MEQLVTVDGGRRVWTCAEGEHVPGRMPVLLINGGPGCCDYLAPVSRMLEDRYHVIRFEQRGCGRSDGGGPYDLQTVIDDMECIRRFCGYERWAVCGHSWGANVALVYAMEHPTHTAALVYMAGNGVQNDRHWSEQYHRSLDERGETIPDMDYPFNREVNAAGNESLRAYGRAPDFYLRVSRLNIAALFVMAQDDIRPSWPAEQLCALMPDASAVRIPDAGHFIWMRSPDALRTALRGFLDAM